MVQEFQNEFRYLSNFWPCKIFYAGRNYASVEHAYQCQKNDSEDWVAFCTDPQHTAADVKRESRKIVVRPDWDNIKVDIMTELIYQKFSSNMDLKEKLLATGDCLIQEGNRWGDVFWGVDLKTNQGKNQMGVIIMNVRSALKNSK